MKRLKLNRDGEYVENDVVGSYTSDTDMEGEDDETRGNILS